MSSTDSYYEIIFESVHIDCLSLAHAWTENYLSPLGITIITIIQSNGNMTIRTDSPIPDKDADTIRDALYSFDCTAMEEKVPEPIGDINPITASISYDFINKKVISSSNVASVGVYKGKGLIINFTQPLENDYGIIAQNQIGTKKSYSMRILEKTPKYVIIYPRGSFNTRRHTVPVTFNAIILGNGDLN